MNYSNKPLISFTFFDASFVPQNASKQSVLDGSYSNSQIFITIGKGEQLTRGKSNASSSRIYNSNNSGWILYMPALTARGLPEFQEQKINEKEKATSTTDAVDGWEQKVPLVPQEQPFPRAVLL